MKTMTCADMGGWCDTAMTASTEEEMMNMGMKHVEEAHPEEAEKIKAMPKEDMDKWGESFHAKWEATPEDEAEMAEATEEAAA